MALWKRLLLISAGFGAGFAICAATMVAAGYLYSLRAKPWNKTAVKASFETMKLSPNPQQAKYSVDFIYTLENTTPRNYDFYPANITIFANLAEDYSSTSQQSPALSKDFGDDQIDGPSIDGPPFIPAHARARFHVTVAYQMPPDFSDNDKRDMDKVIQQVGRRLKELKSIVLFDQSNHYRIDLPKGWAGAENQTGKVMKHEGHGNARTSFEVTTLPICRLGYCPGNYRR